MDRSGPAAGSTKILLVACLFQTETCVLLGATPDAAGLVFANVLSVKFGSDSPDKVIWTRDDRKALAHETV
jgi:hypothetical protein